MLFDVSASQAVTTDPKSPTGIKLHYFCQEEVHAFPSSSQLSNKMHQIEVAFGQRARGTALIELVFFNQTCAPTL
jgi:hypothetical protein